MENMIILTTSATSTMSKLLGILLGTPMGTLAGTSMGTPVGKMMNMTMGRIICSVLAMAERNHARRMTFQGKL